jgi:hypothetical protein
MMDAAISSFVVGAGKQPLFVDKHRARIGGLPRKFRQYRPIVDCLYDLDSKKIAPSFR